MEDKIQNLKIILSKLNIPIAYNHFNAPVQVPYIAFYEESTSNTFADNVVIYESSTIDIELYTARKDAFLEEELKALLNENEIPYEKINETYLTDERIYESVFEINL